ncbi:hypothetical protein [Desulfovermiculus halophilus]|uniref:hypothetical protein n=1 Tax=Desulfovermiculus halophilus TaxID=339722 RepID=UPI000481065D|nr:hypothetical protein [Desulfovermiculus halophilus]
MFFRQLTIFCLTACIWMMLGPQGAVLAESPGEIPRGAMQRLIVEHQGRVYEFGPFVGYYFWPQDCTDLSRLNFACRNERQFYTRDLPEDTLLFTGQARFACLPGDAPYVPKQGRRMRPVFPGDIPASWLATRPEPRDEFVHFHSAYNAQGPAACGFWLRHTAKESFTYDMGGRVGSDSVLYHQVQPGVNKDFPLLVEFDRGPEDR